MPPGRTAAIGSPTFATAFRSSPTTPILLESRPSAPEADQTECYATATLKWRASDASLRFLFKTTVQLIRCTDVLDPTPRSRELFHFYRPEHLAELMTHPQTLRSRLHNQMPLRPVPAP